MPKAYSYIRFSSTKQEAGDSLARQTKLSEEYAAKHGLELDTELSLRDLGISAYDRSNVTKGNLGQFLRLVQEHRIPVGSFLLVESLDRLSRDKVMDALSIFINILQAGIVIVTLSDNQKFSRESANDNWASLIVSIATMSRAYEESAIKSQRLRSAWDSKRKNLATKRLTARCPYWLKPAAGEVGFEFIPDRVEVVKRIFQMSRDGVGSATIVKTLNTQNVPLFSEKTAGWQTSYIEKILQSPAVYGELHLKLQRDGAITPIEVIPDYYPAVITKEEWRLVADARVARRTRGGVSKGANLSNLFSGLLRCGYCNGPMNMGGYVETRTGKRKKSKYIACSNARRGLGCKFIQWEYSDFEQLVLRFCKAVDFARVMGVNQNAEAEINTAILRVEAIKQEIRDVAGRNEKLLDALEQGGQDAAPTLILDRIKANATNQAALEVQKLEAEEHVLRLSNSQVDASVQQNLIVELLDRLEKLEETDLHLLRIRLSEAVKRVIARIDTFPGGRWYSEDEIEEFRRDLDSADAYDGDQIAAMCAKLDAKPNKKNRLLMIVFKNGEHRTVLSSGKVLDQKAPPPAEWDVPTLFESLAFKVFKPTNA